MRTSRNKTYLWSKVWIHTTRDTAQSEGIPDPRGAACLKHTLISFSSQRIVENKELSGSHSHRTFNHQSPLQSKCLLWNEKLHKHNMVVPNIRDWGQPKGQIKRTQSDVGWVSPFPDTLHLFSCRNRRRSSMGVLGRRHREGTENCDVLSASLWCIFSQPRSWGEQTHVSWAPAVGKAPARSRSVFSDSLRSLAHQGLTLLPENILEQESW